MADAPAPSKSSLGFLGRKLGPFPVIVWGGIAFGVYWWWTHRAGAKAAAVPAAPRPQIIEVAGPRGPRGRSGGGRHGGGGGVTHLPPAPRPAPGPQPVRGTAPPVPAPQPAAAPMTGADIYGSVPTAMPDGSTYDSGDVASTMGAAYAVA